MNHPTQNAPFSETLSSKGMDCLSSPSAAFLPVTNLPAIGHRPGSCRNILESNLKDIQHCPYRLCRYCYRTRPQAYAGGSFNSQQVQRALKHNNTPCGADCGTKIYDTRKTEIFIQCKTLCLDQTPKKFLEAPVILEDKELIKDAGNTLTLYCEAKEPITWQPPFNSAESTINYIINVADSSDYEYPYKIKIEVFNMSANDVGYYMCAYNTTSYHAATFSDDELIANKEASRVYVFVNDPSTLLVPIELYLAATEHSEIIIPCRPTLQDVRVTLTINDKAKGNIIELDPHIGFKYFISNESAVLNCTGQRGLQTTQKLVHIFPEEAHTNSVNKPRINDTYHGYATVGGKIQLDCYVDVDDATSFQLDWIVPNYEPTRMNQSDTSSQVNLDYSKTGSRTFQITNISIEDSGTYLCTVIDHSGNKNNASKYIRVLEEGDSHIILSEQANLYFMSITLRPSSTVKIWIDIDAHPTPEITWYDNFNKEIVATGKGSRYTIVTDAKHSILTLRNLTLQDAGVYSIKAQNQYQTACYNMTVQLKAAASVSLYANSFYKYNTSASILCHVDGFPLPKIEWFFKYCDSNISCKNAKQYKIPESQYITVNKKQLGSDTTVTLPINEPLLLMCKAYNDIGGNNASSIIQVSDVDSGLGITGVKKDITVGDYVNITCVVSKYCSLYASLNGNWISRDTDDTISEKNGIKVFKENTKYSHLLILSFANISKNDGGAYICKNYDIIEGCENSEEAMITIHDPKAVKISSANMNGSDITVEIGFPHSFFCKPEGMPIPAVKWYKDNVEISPTGNDRLNISADGKQLYIKRILTDDDGVYKCRAFNRLSEDTKTMRIIVPSQPLRTAYIVIIVIVIIVLIIPIVILAWKIRKERQKIRELSSVGLSNFAEGATDSLNPELGIDEQAELLPYDKKWEFPRDKLKLGKQLGSGAFGVVMKGVATRIIPEEESTKVAVKMVKGTGDPAFIRALASELKIMVHLGKHLNVVNLLGACTKNLAKRELYVIVEYCRFGNLHHYLMRHRANFIDQLIENTDIIDPSIGCEAINRTYSVSSNRSSQKQLLTPLLRSGEQEMWRRDPGSRDMSCGLDTANTVISMLPNGDSGGGITSSGSVQPEWRSNLRGDYNYSKEVRPICTQDLICWSFQIARGMEYLANRKVLHGDLAARNILLAEDNIVKICDFGLAKSMYKSDNYRKKGDGPLPIKWMAVESIRDRVFSTQSDVWSYGIVLWELFSLANTPYPGMDADEKFYQKLIEGYRMEKPTYASNKVYQTMLECWRARPKQRPTFGELAERLGYFLEDSVRNHYVDLNDPYMDMNSRWLAEKEDQPDYLAMVSSPDFDNMASVNAQHEYVNEPFGGPTKVNPLSPDDTDAEGYLCMSPAVNSVITKETSTFDFSTPTSPYKTNADNINEVIPMLAINNNARTSGSGSEEDCKPEERSSNTSFANNSYKPVFIESPSTNTPAKEIPTTQDNYVNMASKEHTPIKDNIAFNLSAFSNPSYVLMNGQKTATNNLYDNLPTTKIA